MNETASLNDIFSANCQLCKA